jgi:hypothetical protein
MQAASDVVVVETAIFFWYRFLYEFVTGSEWSPSHRKAIISAAILIRNVVRGD